MSRRYSFVAALAVVLNAGAAEPSRPAAPTESAFLTIDTPIVELLLNTTTRPVVEKHLPNLAERLLNDTNALELLGASSPRELALDRHVRGVTDELLERLQADLQAAQEKG
jgi:hypothetical protein